MVSARRRVLVTHPGRQHSHQNALALDRAGALAGYWSGVPSVEQHFGSLPGRLFRPFLRYEPVELPTDRTRWMMLPPLLRRGGGLLLPQRLAQELDFFACRSFDRQVAGRLNRVEAKAVIACEISARDTFDCANRRGWTTLLDAPSFHHAAQDRLHGYTESSKLHRRIVSIKDDEIAKADHVLTVSQLARSTYLDAGVAPDKVHAVPLGADLELFTPDGPLPPSVSRHADEDVLFLFAGASIHRKGFDLLVTAFDRVRQDAPTARLRIVGPGGDSAHLADRRSVRDGGDGIEVRGPVTQHELATELRGADCLVLPSRNDSFGMVVAEALGCGTPVIVSEMVGAKDLVEESVSGWIVPTEDADALADRMLHCARDPESLRAMAPAARESAQAATWDAYHRRFATLMRALVPEGTAG